MREVFNLRQTSSTDRMQNDLFDTHIKKLPYGAALLLLKNTNKFYIHLLK